MHVIVAERCENNELHVPFAHARTVCFNMPFVNTESTI